MLSRLRRGADGLQGPATGHGSLGLGASSTCAKVVPTMTSRILAGHAEHRGSALDSSVLLYSLQEEQRPRGEDNENRAGRGSCDAAVVEGSRLKGADHGFRDAIEST